MAGWSHKERGLFWERVANEIEMLDRFPNDFGLWDLGMPPDYFPRHISHKELQRLTSETVKLLAYLMPWIFVMAFKVLEVIHKSTKRKLPKTFDANPLLHKTCEHLYNLLRVPRNKIVHTEERGRSGVYVFPFRERGKVIYEDCLAVWDEHGRRILKLDVYELVFLAIIVASVGKALRRGRVRGGDVATAYDQIDAVSHLMPRDILREYKVMRKEAKRIR